MLLFKFGQDREKKDIINGDASSRVLLNFMVTSTFFLLKESRDVSGKN